MAERTLDKRTGPEDMGRRRYRVLVAAERWYIAGALLLGLFAGLVITGIVSSVTLRQFVATGDPLRPLFQSLILALVTSVTLVLSLNQVVLSQELVGASDQRDRQEAALSFRSEVEDVIEPGVSPATPGRFMAALLYGALEYAESMQEAATDVDEELRGAVDTYVAELREELADTAEAMDEAEFGTFDVTDQSLRVNESVLFYEAQALEAEHGDAFSDRFATAYAGLIDALEHFGLAREYFKSMYIQRELITLSERISYASIPALAAAIGILLFVDETTFTGTTAGVDNLLLVVAAGATLALTPFALLIVYILRIGIITKFTLAIGPFEVE